MELNIRAKYKPKTHDNISSKMIEAITRDLIYDWEWVFKVKKKHYYCTDSILFPTTEPICIDNLEIQE